MEKGTSPARLKKSKMGGRVKAGLFRKSPPSYGNTPPTVKVEKNLVNDEGTVVSEDLSQDHAIPEEEPKHERILRESPQLRLAHDVPMGELDLT